MKKLFLLTLIVALFAACEKNDPVAEMEGDLLLKSVDVTGNGAPSGFHFTLNVIGVDNAKTAPMDDNSGHRIFVPLEGRAKIELIEGEDFAVLDANAFDDPAQFQLPNPELDPYIIGDDMTGIDVLSAYSVYVRPLGKPGGLATITTCADVVDSELFDFLSKKYQSILETEVENSVDGFGGYASVENVALALPLDQKGKPGFENVTAEMLTIVLQVTITMEDGAVETEQIRVPIFDPMLEDEYWAVDNDGLKLIMVRFYPGIKTDVTYADDKLK
ncbi:MAG TPA: hypothetical protein VEP89_05105 [Draconibacterium sp.]|nr:hypothetical protein [Draconibacterium sp.]